MGEMVKVTSKKPEVKRENKVSQTQKTGPSQSISSPVEQILFLQRTIGNQAVGRLIKSGALQAKLKIGQPGDVYEQEADRVAEQVMRMHEPFSASAGAPHIQRACPICDGEELRRQPIEEEEEEPQRQPVEKEEEDLQAKATSDYLSEINPNLESQIQSLKGGGQPLSENDRTFFEPRFGAVLSNVRLHNDMVAANVTRSVNARAFTFGHNIVLGAGESSSYALSRRQLLAHELTHVVQQTRGNRCNEVQCERAARVRPWQEVNARFAGRQSGHPIRLFSHDFADSTSLANALQWIFDNTMARPTSFQFLSERETSATETHEAYLRSTRQPVDWYQEVALVWHLRRRRFVAYTTRLTTSGAIPPGHIFVAHTHPTQSQVPGQGGSLGVSWQTMSPSPNDPGNFHSRQTVSIICHRDPGDNQTLAAFVYNRSRQVLSRYNGPSAFQSAADEFRRLEQNARTRGQEVGQYPNRRRRR